MAKSKQQRLVDDRLWELLEPLIPPRPPARGPGGRPPIDDRAALEGIVFVLTTGCRWRDLPEQLGAGSGRTAWRRLRAWQAAGVWERTVSWVLRFERLGLRDDRTETTVRPLLLLAGPIINLRRLVARSEP